MVSKAGDELRLVSRKAQRVLVGQNLLTSGTFHTFQASAKVQAE